MKYARKPRHRKGRLIGIALAVVVIVGSLSIYAVSNHVVGSSGAAISTASQASSAVSAGIVPVDAFPAAGSQDSVSPPAPKSVTILSTGDILLHLPIVNSCKQADGSYNFDGVFADIQPYVEQADYVVTNLEVTLGGAPPYTGYPDFNSPDSILTGLKNAGFDLLLDANNHAYDNRLSGIQRTVSVIEGAGLDHTGTRADPSGPTYLLKDIGGIKIGFLNYTFETPPQDGEKALNGVVMAAAAAPLVNSFDPEDLTPFYAEIQTQIDNLKAEGAQAILFYPHWGNEYHMQACDYQEKMAQKLCDMGISAIIGGHPHVIEPEENFTAPDGHVMPCLFSMGNAISNQRVALMDLKTGNTEDGVLFETTFTQAADGTVALTELSYIPTWVSLQNGKYRVLPLVAGNDWGRQFGVAENTGTVEDPIQSARRTDLLLQAGVEAYHADTVSAAA